MPHMVRLAPAQPLETVTPGAFTAVDEFVAHYSLETPIPPMPVPAI